MLNLFQYQYDKGGAVWHDKEEVVRHQHDIGMKLLYKIKRLVFHDIWEMQAPHRLGKFFHRQLRIFFIVAKGFVDDRCLLRASALTYITLLSIVPLLAVAFSTLKGFGVQNTIRDIALKRVAGNLEQVVEQIASYVDKIDVTALGVVGLGALICTVIMMLSQIERTFNEIWGVKVGRTILRKISDYLSVLIISPLMMAIATSITASIQSKAVVKKVMELGLSQLAHLLPLVTAGIAFSFLYAFMPNTKVKMRSAIVGGVWAGSLWHIAQWCYINFQIGATRYNAIYGSFAQFPLFLIWVHFSWVIALLGAEISFAHQHVKTYKREQKAFALSVRSQEMLALQMLISIGECFKNKADKWSPEWFSTKWNIPIRLINELLFRLEKINTVVRVGDRDSYYYPSRPLKQISIEETIAALRNYSEKEGNALEPVKMNFLRELFDQLDAACSKRLTGLTLEEAVERSHGSHP